MFLPSISNARTYEEASVNFTKKIQKNNCLSPYILESHKPDKLPKITKCQHVVFLTEEELPLKKLKCGTCNKSYKIKNCKPLDPNLLNMINNVREFVETTNRLQAPEVRMSGKELKKERLACKKKIIQSINEAMKNDPTWGIKKGKIEEVKLITLLTPSYPYLEDGEIAHWLETSEDIKLFCAELKNETGLNIYSGYTPMQMGYSFSFAAHFYASL
jgi:hypothetical protein